MQNDTTGTHVPLTDARLQEEEVPSRRRKIIVTSLVVAGLALGGYLLFGGKEREADFAPKQTTAAVTVVAPGRQTVEGVINATGTLAARRPMPVGVVGDGGRVVTVFVEPGDWVSKGQTLAVIDRSVQTQQAASSAASIDVARADAQLAQANLDRALKLVERGFVSKADVDRLTATRDAAAARVSVSRAQYNELLARNARLNIVAPEAGLVLEREVEPGQVVGAGAAALFTIAKAGEMELLARVGESDLAKLKEGSTASVVPVGTEKVFTGQIWQLAPIIDPTTRQGTARIALSYAPELRPGGFASVQIKSGTVVAPVLPESAIQSTAKGTYVYLVDANNKAVRREVTLGDVTENGLVIASGLEGNEQVVLRAGGFLSDGETVRPVKPKNAR